MNQQPKNVHSARARGLLDRVLDNAVWLLLLLTVLVMGLLNPAFLNVRVLRVIASESAVLGVLALAVALTLLLGEIDLSVSGALGLAAFVGAWFMFTQGVGPILAIVLMLLVGAALGLINGLLIAKLKMNSLIETLAVMLTLEGALLFFARGRTTVGFPTSFLWVGQRSILGVPVLALVLISIYGVAEFLLQRTTFGRRLYATGGNRKAAHASGINIDRMVITVFLISGTLAGFAGFLLASRTGAVTSVFGSGFLLYSVAAPIMGGVSLLGGRGKMLGVLGGVLLLSVIDTGLQFANVSAYEIRMVGGLLILAALGLDALQARIRKVR